MANQSELPLLYSSVVPLSSVTHAEWKARPTERAAWLARENVVPLTVDEFRHAQRHYPVVFSTDEEPVPLALMSLVPGSNAFVDADGSLKGDTYLPAYARRYPFILARRAPDAPELSLCFDAGSDQVGAFDEGQPLFEGGAPSSACSDILGFCESFEQAAARTRAFVEELQKHDLLVDGEATVQTGADGQRQVFKGFRIVDEQKLRKIRGYVYRQWTESGVLPLIFAHLFSLELMPRLAAARPAPAELLLRNEFAV